MASLDFSSERDRFKEFYASNAPILRDAADSLRTLLSLLLTDHDDFSTPQVESRVKERDECIAKFARKYQTQCEEASTPYEIKDYITDLVGLRVICLYETDVQKIRAVLADGFEIVDETDKILAMETQEGVFGYKGLHLDLRLLGNRRALPEYRRFQNLRFEVQLRTIVQDAWSVLDHKIKYKKNIPLVLKRRINRLAALFELADQEFLHIREETQRLEEEATAVNGTVVPVPTVPEDDPLDAFSFLRVVKKWFSAYSFHDHKVDGFVSELLATDPSLTAGTLESALKATDSDLQKYRAYQYERFRNRLNPYTTIRHALYAQDREKYSQLIFDLQRATFDSWRDKGDKEPG
jgi:putative GTP pyrophosphokinase